MARTVLEPALACGVRTHILIVFFSAILALVSCSSQVSVSPSHQAPTSDGAAAAVATIADTADEAPDVADLRAEDLDLSIESAAALLKLPVTEVPMELVLVHDDELNVRHVDLTTG